ncbi:unnamed protein product [Adineta steineri]|uniref:Ubiquitin-like protease family profile domain-containing protein n=1 Tax=Adineta steineri TaxID=433720 RepID=A0A819I793_9BILA|nr:unnamed protein product [Adineta steineri]CAF3911957.1 unnamed protein product [Adineta steineri]
MAYSENSGKHESVFNLFQQLLEKKLQESQRNTPEQFSKQMYALASINGDVEGQLKSALEKETHHHKGERIVLIPYCLENSHWSGILIEFQANEEIQRVEYIDSMTGFDVIPEKVKKEFADVFPNVVICIKDLQKESNVESSAKLTFNNLVTAAKYAQLYRDNDLVTNQLQEEINNNDNTSICSAEHEQLHSMEKTENNMMTTNSILEDNKQLKVQQLQQKLTAGLGKSRTLNTDE